MSVAAIPTVLRFGPFIRPRRRPATPHLNASAGNLSAERKRLAEQVVESVFEEVARRLAMPSVAWRSAERRAVRVWGVIEISVSRDGIDLQARPVSRDPEISTFLAYASLSRPIGSLGWCAAMEPILVAACREHGLPPQSLPGPTGGYIRRVLSRSFDKYVDWNHLRREALRFLNLDPLVVSLSRRVFPCGLATLDDFNWVASHARELALVGIEHPELLRFLELVRKHDDRPMRAFERMVRFRGMRPGARRKLELLGFEAFAGAFDVAGDRDALDVLVDLANLFERLEIPYAPPPLFGELAAHALAAGAPDWFQRALWLEVQSLDDNYPGERLVPGDCELAIGWIGSRPREPDENQKRAGWAWIAQQARKHRVADPAARELWKVPLDAREIDGYEIVPIRNLGQLCEEAEAMRNCLDTLAADCRSGRIAVFSIRRDHRRLASFTLEKFEGGPTWHLLEIAGKANRAMPELVPIAIRAAGMAPPSP